MLFPTTHPPPHMPRMPLPQNRPRPPPPPSVSDIHDQRGRRHVSEVQQQHRRASIMFDLAMGLLRLLEFMAVRQPSSLLDPATFNATRLLELLQFVLGHFTVGSDARRLTELLSQSQGAGAGPSGGGPLRGLERSGVLSDKVGAGEGEKGISVGKGQASCGLQGAGGGGGGWWGGWGEG